MIKQRTLQMKLPKIIQKGPNCNHICPYKRNAKGDQTQSRQCEGRAEGDLKMLELDIRLIQPQTKEYLQLPESG